ncbi:MAG: MATE family efflux transporter [Spirochaetaceae bacterium]
MKQSRQLDLGVTPIKKVFWSYAIPSILAMIAQNTATLVDSIFIGRFVGPEGLSAVSLFFPAVGILIAIGAMIAIGATSLAGIDLGAGRIEKSNNIFNVTVVSLTGIGLLSAIILFNIMKFVPGLVGATGLTAKYLIDYGLQLSGFFPFFLLNFAFMFFLKLDGKPHYMIISSICSTLINITLDYLFIVKFGWLLRGAALATGLSQIIPWIILFSAIIIKSRWKLARPHFHFLEIKNIIFNGSSEFLSNIAYSLAGMIFNIMILKKIGVMGVAAYAVALQVANLVGSIAYGFGESNQAGVSYNYGAKLFNRVDGFRKQTMLVTFITGLILAVISFWKGEFISSLFVTDLETIKMATYILKFYSFAFIFTGLNIAIGTYYTAINDPVRSGGITLYRSFIGLIIGLVLFIWLFGNNGLWMAIIFSEVSSFIIGIIMLKKSPHGNPIKETGLQIPVSVLS